MYQALFTTMYFGLFRIGEVTHSPHVLKAMDVHCAVNKLKMKFILHSSKTHGKGDKPQIIKIVGTRIGSDISQTTKITIFAHFRS